MRPRKQKSVQGEFSVGKYEVCRVGSVGNSAIPLNILNELSHVNECSQDWLLVWLRIGFFARKRAGSVVVFWKICITWASRKLQV